MTVYSLCSTQNIKLERWCVLRNQDSIKLVYLTASPRASFRESGFCLFTRESDEEYNKYKNTVSNFTNYCFGTIIENVNTTTKENDALVSRK